MTRRRSWRLRRRSLIVDPRPSLNRHRRLGVDLVLVVAQVVAPGTASEPPYLLMTSLAALGKTLNIINHDHIRDSRVLPAETQTMKPLPVPGFYDKLGLFALMYKACGSAVHA